MSKSIWFYNVGIFKNNELTTLNFGSFIDKIDRVEWNDKVRKIDNDIAAVFPLIFDDSHKEMRIIPFGKFRTNYKPYTCQIQTPVYNEIKEDVVELVTLVYNSNYRSIALDFSIYGARKKLIEQYFSSFLPQDGDDIWEVRLSEVMDKFDKEDLIRASKVRGIQLVIDMSKNQRDFINKTNDKNNKFLIKFFRELSNTSGDVEANTIKLEFDAPKGKDATMNKQAILLWIESLNIDLDSLKSVKVKYKGAGEIIEEIDLKNINHLLKTEVLKDSNNKNPAPQFLGMEIIAIYSNFTGRLVESMNSFMNGAKRAILPEIVQKPMEINKVKE